MGSEGRDMEKIREFKKYECAPGVMQLCSGAPGPEALRGCKEICLQASTHMMEGAGGLDVFKYGNENGDADFRQGLATYLTNEYGDEVSSEDLVVTAGASQALHVLVSVLLGHSCPVFIEDPSYFAAIRFFRDDLRMPVFPVSTDEEGLVTAELDSLLAKHRPSAFEATVQSPFWAAVYVIPVFSNPTGMCYSAERCRELVKVARKWDVLVVAEDVYNLLHFQDGGHPPPRLFSYDSKRDADYRGGHVVSIGTFSKILAPGLRLGWLEAPPRVALALQQSHLAWGGGSFNHYVSCLASAALELGLQQQHTCLLRRLYKQRMAVFCKELRENLPAGCDFKTPQGGYFVWVSLPRSVDTFALLRQTVTRHQLNFLPGFCASLTGRYEHCVRLSISCLDQDALKTAAALFCQAVREFLQ